MKRLLSLLIAVLSIGLMFTGCGKTDNKPSFVPKDYTLAYSDEFNGTELDESVWVKEQHGARRGGYWSPEQVRLENGNLMIETAYKENVEDPGYYSGAIRWNTQRSTYGYYEARLKIQNIRGQWPAFWLMPDTMGEVDGKAVDGAEIDIFESAVPYIYQYHMHYDNYESKKKKIQKIDNLYDEYHVFALDWKKDSMTFYVDGQILEEITDPDLISATPVAMWLSTEIGGKPDKDGVPKPGIFWVGNGVITESKDLLPACYEVDYVRVYDNGDLILTK